MSNVKCQKSKVKSHVISICADKSSASIIYRFSVFFDEKLEEKPWSNLEATLWYIVQRLPLFKEQRMMVKLKNICDDRESGEFAFRVFLCKRPEVYPSWNFDDPVSDDEEAPQNPFLLHASQRESPLN